MGEAWLNWEIALSASTQRQGLQEAGISPRVLSESSLVWPRGTGWLRGGSTWPPSWT
jgi:hypothetical protein